MGHRAKKIYLARTDEGEFAGSARTEQRDMRKLLVTEEYPSTHCVASDVHALQKLLAKAYA